MMILISRIFASGDIEFGSREGHADEKNISSLIDDKKLDESVKQLLNHIRNNDKLTVPKCTTPMQLWLYSTTTIACAKYVDTNSLLFPYATQV
jgi:hypothetical protein